ncbi:uncharacterized protein LOC102807518 [Saccoglossus kowalevskii]
MWKLLYSQSAGNAMCLSKQTVDELKMTVHSFVEVSKYLLNHGVDFILSERFRQDPLQAHFSKHRHRGGANNNPTVMAFGYQENVIRLQKSYHMQCITGNTGRHKRHKRRPLQHIVDDTSLPKQKC